MNSSKQLKGHSGARLSIEISNGLHCVRKQAADISKNGRLKSQANKQIQAFQQGVACPSVIAEGEIDDCYYFDMEYIPSISVAQSIIESSPFDKDKLLDFLCNMLDGYAKQTNHMISANVFLDKITSIENACKSNDVLSDVLPAIQEIVAEMKLFDWSNIPESPCHGDLTLENILISKNQGLMLVDFDSVEINSFYLDIAKLFQDLAGHWCLREIALSEPGNIKFLNAMLSLESLGSKLLNRFSQKWPKLSDKILQMTIFHLIRVLPYCKQTHIAVYVIMRIRQILFRRDATLFGFLN